MVRSSSDLTYRRDGRQVKLDFIVQYSPRRMGKSTRSFAEWKSGRAFSRQRSSRRAVHVDWRELGPTKRMVGKVRADGVEY